MTFFLSSGLIFAMKFRAFALLILLMAAFGIASAAPPFWGTIFIDPDIITQDDPSTFQSLAYSGKAIRKVFDRRVNRFIKVKAHLFKACYRGSRDVEVRVNSEFGSKAKAKVLAIKYAAVVGRLPACLRKNLKTMTIHDGLKPFGGGSGDLLIHTLQGDQYEEDGILEETIVHETSHVSLDRPIAKAPGWVAAQKQDVEFISTYAGDNPTREDVAESFLPYLAVRQRRDRISNELATTIEATIPARMRYFDSLRLKMKPL
jgi:hypothetical protein